MTVARSLPPPLIIESEGLKAHVLWTGAVISVAEVSVVDIAGAGAVACLQGLLTNDLEKTGDGAFVYAAVLTPKGMIITDLWASRLGTTVSVAIPSDGAEPLRALLTRTIPPRLARVTDHASDVTVFRIAGPCALEIAARAGLTVPAAGRAALSTIGEVECLASRPLSTPAPFCLQIQIASGRVDAVLDRLKRAGAVVGGPPALDLARVLAGWPRLGAEIDQKTLPQEVRFDEIGGVSYTKGCYTGQETVARIHFRGHPNRRLVGLLWDTAPDLTQPAVIRSDNEIGRVTSAVRLATGERDLGLAIVRRETSSGDEVMAGAAPAQILDLPFDPKRLNNWIG